VNPYKVLSPEQVSKLRDLALRLIEHPEELPDASGELADLLSMAVSFADILLAEPAEIPDWLQRDPEMRHIMVDQMCREWMESGSPIPAPYWAWLVLGYRELLAAVRQAYQHKEGAGESTKPRQRRGVQAVGRMMTFLIEGAGWAPTKAAEIIGKAVNIDPDSALREYHRYQKEGK